MRREGVTQCFAWNGDARGQGWSAADFPLTMIFELDGAGVTRSGGDTIDERYYGRAVRPFHIGVVNRPDDNLAVACVNVLSVAAVEAVPAFGADDLRTIVRHVRI